MVTVDGIEYVLTKNGVVVLRAPASVRDLDVPNEIYGLPVLAIGDRAFYGCSSLKSIDLPDSVTTIGDCAFSGCDSLNSIDLPYSVTTIGDSAFSGCSLLTSVEVSEKNENYISVDGVLFTKDRKTFVQYPAGKKDKEYAIPSGVTTIGGAFSGCSSLESIDLPDSVTTIGIAAFRGCSSLESIVIPDSVTTIGNEAFDGCPSLTIRAPKGSFAEEYAKEKKIKFEAAE